MGDYADFEIDRSLSEHLDFSYGNTNYNTAKNNEVHEYNYDSIKIETQKSWLLVMNGGNEMWFPKSVCTISKESIFIPDWLNKKKLNE